MSYALRLAGDAAADLRSLDPSLGEDVLDELEALTRDPSALRPDAIGEAVHDFERQFGGARHTIFIRLHIDPPRQLLTVLSIADHISGPSS